ncbi:Putative nucleotidyltransferase DUF294 [Xaviernesmea oryzae]|uniref:Putative nucleotidyltransferase DUF294 n=1 Tax=Xaviernesmea oryzae TaxID=464029 RepID=A0A1X7DZS7_9HYPH|nr:DUF294 nucleotidyltransferase-like domain-containing protein [Xaviernesmea oryzae]SMF24369.1 Putative nucleotidyltransferase DUF294 [Xaviernesmea oryzae]
MSTGADTSDFNRKLMHFHEQSVAKLETMRDAAKAMFEDTCGFVIGVNGSLARREYTSGSDVDLFFLVLDGDIAGAKAAQEKFRQKMQEVGVKMPASGGVFEEPLPADEMLATIGGNDDTNTFITRRMLFLLEGEWIFNRSAFEETRQALVGRYVEEGLDDKKICLFLLNDIIRYWRTICVDYEYKIAGGGKAKAVRLIKLRFSRMLLYFAGVVAIGQTQGVPYEEKRKILDKLLSTPPIERLRSVIGDKSQTSLQLYTEFLVALDDPETRKQLELLGDDGLSTTAYAVLSEKARAFKDSLFQILVTELGTGHPVIKALLL